MRNPPLLPGFKKKKNIYIEKYRDSKRRLQQGEAFKTDNGKFVQTSVVTFVDLRTESSCKENDSPSLAGTEYQIIEC